MRKRDLIELEAYEGQILKILTFYIKEYESKANKFIVFNFACFDFISENANLAMLEITYGYIEQKETFIDRLEVLDKMADKLNK